MRALKPAWKVLENCYFKSKIFNVLLQKFNMLHKKIKTLDHLSEFFKRFEAWKNVVMTSTFVIVS